MRARLVTDQVGTALLSGQTRLLTVGDAAVAQGEGDVEVTGTFIDVGRLTQDDQRVGTYGLVALSQKVLQRDWPAQGELPSSSSARSLTVEPVPAPSVRGLALDPHPLRWPVGHRERALPRAQPVRRSARGARAQQVRLRHPAGRLERLGRGPATEGAGLRSQRRRPRRHGPLAGGPGRRAHGQGPGLDRGQGRAGVQARSENAPVETTTEVAAPPPPPQVIFSTPTADEVDVAADVRVRLQFSRDMTAAVLQGQRPGGLRRARSRGARDSSRRRRRRSSPTTTRADGCWS